MALRGSVLAVVVGAVVLVVAVASYSTLSSGGDRRTAAESSMITTSAMPNGTMGATWGDRGTYPDQAANWYQPGLRSAYDKGFTLRNWSTYDNLVFLWVIIEEYNTSAEALDGLNALQSELSQNGSKVAPVAIGEKGFHQAIDQGEQTNVTHVVFAKCEFTVVMQFDPRNAYPWTLDDSLVLARIQADKMP